MRIRLFGGAPVASRPWGRDARHGARPFRPANGRGGPLGLPADFLIAPSGWVNAVKYGTDAYDQWSVDELLTLAKGVAALAA
jgi:hypothetical protein